MLKSLFHSTCCGHWKLNIMGTEIILAIIRKSYTNFLIKSIGISVFSEREMRSIVRSISQHIVHWTCLSMNWQNCDKIRFILLYEKRKSTWIAVRAIFHCKSFGDSNCRTIIGLREKQICLHGNRISSWVLSFITIEAYSNGFRKFYIVHCTYTNQQNGKYNVLTNHKCEY